MIPVFRFSHAAGLRAGRCEQPKPTGGWMNMSLSPDQRAGLLLKQPTLREKVQMLYGVGPGSPTVFCTAVALMVLACLIAALLPAWRAVSINPATALRQE